MYVINMGSACFPVLYIFGVKGIYICEIEGKKREVMPGLTHTTQRVVTADGYQYTCPISPKIPEETGHHSRLPRTQTSRRVQNFPRCFAIVECRRRYADCYRRSRSASRGEKWQGTYTRWAYSCLYIQRDRPGVQVPL